MIDDYSNPPTPADWTFNGWPGVKDIHAEISMRGNYDAFRDRPNDLWAPFAVRGYVLGVSRRRRKASQHDNGAQDWTNFHVLLGSSPLAAGEMGEPLFAERDQGGMRVMLDSRRAPNRYIRHFHFFANEFMTNTPDTEPEETNALISAWRHQEPITLTGWLYAMGGDPTEAGRRMLFTGFDRRHTCPTGIIGDVRGANGEAPPRMLSAAALAFWRARLRVRSYWEHERFNWLRLTPEERRTFPRSKTA